MCRMNKKSVVSRKAKRPFRKTPAGRFTISFFSMFMSVFMVLEILDWCEIYVIEFMQKSKFLIYLVLVVIFALASFIISRKKEDTAEENDQGKSNPIEEIIRHAWDLGHYKSIILLGDALRQSNCIKNKNNLKLFIGKYVAESAQKIGDVASEATALIEDLGNTYLENREVRKASQSIEKGIKAIERVIGGGSRDVCQDGAYYIAIRGYRNLANSYALNEDKVAAETQLTIARQYTTKMVDEALKLQSLGDIEYSESKISRISADWNGAIGHLNASIEYYDQLCELYPSEENEKKREESTTKNYRELGYLYLETNARSQARDAVDHALKYAEKNKDYENLVLIYLCKAKLEKKEDPNGTGVSIALSEAEKYAGFVDASSVLEQLRIMKKDYQPLGAGK